MNDIRLRQIRTEEDRAEFTREVQSAFQSSYESEFGPLAKPVLPAEDVLESFNAKGAETYAAEFAGERIGGAVIVVDRATGRGSLDLLYIRQGLQNGGLGFKLWKALEATHPEVRIWETHTPWYDRRNIHFYVNRCGFRIVEFFNPRHRFPHGKDGTVGNIPGEHSLFFRFEKEMKPERTYPAGIC